ncbi:MAG: DUF3160 domain-containing protein [Syntrophomonadaceae bacterium]|nr:DUF3160 domain-containing protein [Syntrophomonadaceae bacterium]
MGRICFRRSSKALFFLFLLVFLANGTVGCGKVNDTNSNINTAALKPIAGEFAYYQKYALNINPSVPPQPSSIDLSTINNYLDFDFSPSAAKLLRNNHFVVVPSESKEFYQLYANNDGIPNFITTDAMLHTYHLYYSYLLRSTERSYLYSEVNELSQAMLQVSAQQYQILKDSPWENAARRNVAYFAVACRLLDPNCQVPAAIEKAVADELGLISRHEDTQRVSPVMNLGQNLPPLLQLKEDYTQYVPRGHYAMSDVLTRYFQAMMWYGRLSFRTNNEDESRSALLMVLALNSNDNLNRWQDIYQLTSFFAGKSDDYTYPQYQALFTKVYGPGIKYEELVKNRAQWEQFRQELARLSPPAINSIPIYDRKTQPERDKAITAFRFMGQRYNLDAHIFQNLVYDAVLENPQGKYRQLPLALDIPAAMGSKPAYQLLQAAGETQYKNYPENMQAMQTHISSLDQASWVQDLYWSWLHNLKPLLDAPVQGYPSFMQKEAWQLKDLNTFLGSWTELKHDSILYAKQAYVACGCLPPKVKAESGYVEPRPYVYANLASLCHMTREGLEKRKLINEADADMLLKMEKLSVSLKCISEKELNGGKLSEADELLVRNIGNDLYQFWSSSLKDLKKGETLAVEDHPAALVADVVTNPDLRLVLEEATGNIFTIYALVPVDGKLQLARGGVYSWYEFPWPADNRLTDKQWQEMQTNPDTAKMSKWAKSYIAFD